MTALATGHCLFCLQPLPGATRSVETGKILGLSEFERVRGQVKRSRGRKAARSVSKGLIWALAGSILFGLLYLCMGWLIGFFGKGTAWRQ